MVVHRPPFHTKLYFIPNPTLARFEWVAMVYVVSLFSVLFFPSFLFWNAYETSFFFDIWHEMRKNEKEEENERICHEHEHEWMLQSINVTPKINQMSAPLLLFQRTSNFSLFWLVHTSNRLWQCWDEWMWFFVFLFRMYFELIAKNPVFRFCEFDWLIVQ